MKSSLFLIPITLLGVGFANAGTINTYTSESLFLSAIHPGYFQETFSTSTTGKSLSYSGHGYAYTISASDPLQTSYGWLQETVRSDIITITFTSGTVRAIGGDFFAVNLWAQPKGTTDTLTFSDGTKRTITTGTSTTSFTGYTFDRPITSLKISAATSAWAPRWAALDNLTIGTAAPEPGTWTLLGAGVGLLALVKLKRR